MGQLLFILVYLYIDKEVRYIRKVHLLAEIILAVFTIAFPIGQDDTIVQKDYDRKWYESPLPRKNKMWYTKYNKTKGD